MITVDPFLVFLSIKVEKYIYLIASRKIKGGLLIEKFENQCPEASLRAHMSVPKEISHLPGTTQQAAFQAPRVLLPHLDFQPLGSIPPSAHHTRLQELPPALSVTGHHRHPPCSHTGRALVLVFRIWAKSSLTQPFIVRMCWCPYLRSLRTYSETYLVNQLYIPFSK